MAPIIQPREDIGGEYGQLAKSDIITPVTGMFSSGWMMDDDGVAKPLSDSAMEVVTPWIHPVPGKDKDCGLWHTIMFDEYHILPSPCMECWKVVVTPQTITELFRLHDFQSGIVEGLSKGPAGLDRGCGHPCKCGIEIRPYTSKLYGGYFYNSSLDEGMECYQWVRKEMTALFGEGIKVILKRACTEFEMAFGPSNKWFVSEEQLDKEEQIMNLFDRRNSANPPRQPSVLSPSIKKRWIQWAFQNGDNTYRELTNGEPLYYEAVTYHELDLSKIRKTTAVRHTLESNSGGAEAVM